MVDEIQYYLRNFELNEPVALSFIQDIEKQLQFHFSKEYSDFLLISNGGEGEVGQSCLMLWKIEELIELNEAYGVQDFAPELLIIGVDGGDTAYCLDTRSDDKPFVSVPIIGMDIREVRSCGNNLKEFLGFLYSK